MILPSQKHGYVLALIWSITALVGLCEAVFFLPPHSSAHEQIVQIEEGDTLSDIALKLERQDVVKSAIAFEVLTRLYGGETHANAGYYVFDSTETTSEVVQRVISGDYRLARKRVVVYEGETIKQMSKQFQELFPLFDSREFTALSEGEEGQLFPDTYFFFSTASAFDMYKAMRENFDAKIEPLQSEIDASGKSLNQILTMASILEKEAGSNQDKRIISGVLWKRIDRGMKLQVDAVFPYILGKNTFQLSYDDLAIDSPYNTYKYAGLPPGPIGNPGLDAIKAALEPASTKYLYYLADLSGATHYATTFAQHQRNIDIYLR